MGLEPDVKIKHRNQRLSCLKMSSSGCHQECFDVWFCVWSLIKVVLAAIKGANGKPRLSAYDLQKAIMEFFTENKLYPTGVYSDIPAVQEWALKYAVALKKLVPLQCHVKKSLSYVCILYITL